MSATFAALGEFGEVAGAPGGDSLGDGIRGHGRTPGGSRDKQERMDHSAYLVPSCGDALPDVVRRAVRATSVPLPVLFGE